MTDDVLKKGIALAIYSNSTPILEGEQEILRIDESQYANLIKEMNEAINLCIIEELDKVPKMSSTSWDTIGYISRRKKQLNQE